MRRTSSHPLDLASGGRSASGELLASTVYVPSTNGDIGVFQFDDGGHSFDIANDGVRFLMVRIEADFAQLSEFIVVQNWFEELERLVPTD